LKCDGTRAETRFRLSAKRTSLFKSAGESVQSTTGSRVVRISGSNAGYTMFRGSVKSTGYPLHSPVYPSLPLPVRHCVPSHFNWTLPIPLLTKIQMLCSREAKTRHAIRPTLQLCSDMTRVNAALAHVYRPSIQTRPANWTRILRGFSMTVQAQAWVVARIATQLLAATLSPSHYATLHVWKSRRHSDACKSF
jgi:hypothetical protein